MYFNPRRYRVGHENTEPQQYKKREEIEKKGEAKKICQQSRRGVFLEIDDFFVSRVQCTSPARYLKYFSKKPPLWWRFIEYSCLRGCFFPVEDSFLLPSGARSVRRMHTVFFFLFTPFLFVTNKLSFAVQISTLKKENREHTEREKKKSISGAPGGVDIDRSLTQGLYTHPP